jgi:hypothetical protein
MNVVYAAISAFFVGNLSFGINHVFEFTIFTNLEKTDDYAAK